ncbi:butyrophilin subfamily 1 member A1-like isoform X3 [Lepidochelys kempii]|uniref:butyrophilin subfamily 1 member A1-like isoform X3 n=1 Tax=Lepidochelys kempii TaxID=8472 RepID=UPI003C6F1D45
MTAWIKSIAIPFLYIISKCLWDGFTVTVHVDPAIALVGQGVMLSCQPGGHNPTNVQVHWYKWERSKNMTLYFYNSTENGTELGRVGDQHRSDAPRGRYENGIVTVKLFPVQVEDSGQYVCAVTNDGVYQEAIAQVIVAGFGSAPHLTIDHQQNNSVTLRCTSQGWYPQPEVCWTDSTGQNITAMAETRIQKDGTDLYQIHSMLRVADTASDTISCTIRNPLLKRHLKKVIAISGFFDVEAEHDTITTVIGENTILPCRLITKHLPPSMELQWRKVGPGKDKIIYFYLYDESSPQVNSYPQSDKCPMSYLSPNGDNSREWLRKEYEKKAEVFKGKEFGKGNISLKLNNIQMEDEGKYVCSASANLFHREIITEVLVIGVGNETSLQMHLQKVCKYECKWKGWYPKPMVFWRNHKGQSINSLAETTEVQDEQNLFTVASTIAVSCDTPEITCAIVNTESEMIQQSTAQHFVGFLICILLFIAVTVEHFFGKCKSQFQNVIDQVQRVREQSHDDYDRLRIEMDQLQSERAQLQGQIDQQQREMNELQRQRAAMRNELAQLKEDNERKADHSQADSERKKDHSQAEHLEEEMAAMRNELEQLQREIAQLKEDNERKADHSQADSERKKDHSQAEHLEEEMAAMRNELEQLQREIAQLKEDNAQVKENMEWRRVRNNSDDITLDADTAHPNLSIAPNKKSLKHEAQPQKVPANAERFDSTVCVLGSEGFFSGKHYWEVEVVSSTDWDLGVARTSIQRKGKLSLSPKEGFWALGLSGRDYWAKTDPWTRVMVQKKPQKIGVYLSHQDRQVTFLNVTDMSVLFTFNDCSFSGEVYPFFKNSHKETTMRICSIKEE